MAFEPAYREQEKYRDGPRAVFHVFPRERRGEQQLLDRFLAEPGELAERLFDDRQQCFVGFGKRRSPPLQLRGDEAR